MEKYIEQLLADISYATKHVSLPIVKRELELEDWLSEEEEDKIAPVRNLEEWTGISKVQLPPGEMLLDKQVHLLLEAIKKMLNEYNWSFVLQIEVPERIQYESLRINFDQKAKIKQWHHGFFEHCREGSEHKKCALKEYCQCAFYAELFSGFIDEDLSPEEERNRELEIEIQHLKRKYGDHWMNYYPYHLDEKYDDDNGNPHDFGFRDEEENDNDDWWRS